VLCSRNVALALLDHAYMPQPAEVFDKLDPVTVDFAYIRWLGDRTRGRYQRIPNHAKKKCSAVISFD
jgi:hypothetical protein